MSTADVCLLDGLRQAELVRRGEIAPDEPVVAALRRVEELDPTFNAVPIRRFDEALAEARDPRRASAPFASVPFLLKDLGPTQAGLETTVGSAFLAGFVPSADGELVTRFRAAGLVTIGKSNTAEFGVLPTTEPAHHGPTRNPWAPDRTAGGSSGGAAAAVAAGMVPVAHANDAGGSIRIPASCCGVFGLKPTRARTPMGPAVGDLMNGLASEFVVSRSVRDSAALLDLVGGPALGDPYWAPPGQPCLAAAEQDPPRPLHIAFSTDGLDQESAVVVRKTAALCEELGHRVVEATPRPRFADVRDLFLTVWAAGVSSAVSTYAAASGREPRPDLLEPTTWWLYERGRAVSAAEYLVTITRLQQAARALAAFHEPFDVHLGGVTDRPAPPLGELVTGSPEEQLDKAIAFALDTPLANLTGQPAMSVPLGSTTRGVPIGVHATARFGDEATLFALAGQLERACPWALSAPVA